MRLRWRLMLLRNNNTLAHHAVQPRVGWVQVGPQELEAQQSPESEDAGRGRLH